MVTVSRVPTTLSGRGVGQAMSSYVAGTVLGGFLGRFISGMVATHWHWRATFLVLAGLNLIGAIAGRARSSAAGLYVTFYYLGGGLGATVTGWFWRWAAWPGCVALLAGISLLSFWLARVSSRPSDHLDLAEIELVGDWLP